MLLFPVRQPAAGAVNIRIPGLLSSFHAVRPVADLQGTAEHAAHVCQCQCLWLLLTSPQQGSAPELRFGRGIVCLTVINLLLVLAFPPYESFLTLMRSQAGFFEGFYFVLGTKFRRTIMWPLLQLECMLIVVNALAHYLVFSGLRRRKEAARATAQEIANSRDGKDHRRSTPSRHGQASAEQIRVSLTTIMPGERSYLLEVRAATLLGIHFPSPPSS